MNRFMPDYDQIYHHHADQYERLIAREDYQGNLFNAINQITPFTGMDVVEFGAGTGRLTCMLAPVVKSIQAFDSSSHMLETAVKKLEKLGLHNWQVEVGDHRKVGAADRSANVVISGWSMCYLVVGNDKTWQEELNNGLKEMRRVVRKDGFLIIIETLGTGHETPAPPADLEKYFRYLEENGFRRSWIRTDYLFQNMEEAQELTRFFFGDDMSDKITKKEGCVILPECTGIWQHTII
jgi:ubiquinone/menaquinone biosynthesis C-methylase UbiE